MTTITISKRTASRKIKLDRYAGKWVALIDDKVIAWGRNLEELENKIKRLKLKVEPTFFLVPRKDEGLYVL